MQRIALHDFIRRMADAAGVLNNIQRTWRGNAQAFIKAVTPLVQGRWKSMFPKWEVLAGLINKGTKGAVKMTDKYELQPASLRPGARPMMRQPAMAR